MDPDENPGDLTIVRAYATADHTHNIVMPASNEIGGGGSSGPSHMHTHVHNGGFATPTKQVTMTAKLVGNDQLPVIDIIESPAGRMVRVDGAIIRGITSANFNVEPGRATMTLEVECADIIMRKEP